ncbi:MAG: hypothetical protein IJP49_02960 [Bacteroidales bacterium]|nr:hypothetical protein [Bacteroidales bacterium]
MKKIIYIAFAAAALAAVSCAKNAEFDSVKGDLSQGLTIRFTTGDLATRATVEGVDNENLIKKIDYFIFPYNVDDEGKMVGTTEYVYKGTVVPEDDGLAGTYEETFAPGVLNDIFPNGATKAMVFAVANFVDKYGAAVESPNMTIPETVKTWEDLHALEVGETFFKDGGPGFELRWPRVMQPSPYEVTTEGEGGASTTETVTDDLFFVMTGEEEIELVTTGSYAVDAEIPLKRLASKVTVDFTYENVIEEKQSGNIYWVPQPSGEETRVYLSNAIEHTTLGGPLTRDLVADSWATCTKPQPGGDGSRDIFEYSYDFMADIAEVDGVKTAHYYTYPISMEEGDDNQPYLKLVLPWYGYKWVGEGTAPETVDPTSSSWQMYKQKEVYYKIVLPRKTICDPNYIYEFHVNVNIIGSDREIKIIGEEYVVKDWLTKDPVSSNVATGRYISLDIPKDEYNMYVDEIDITFVSSGTVLAIVDDIYQWNYSGSTPTKDHFMQNDEVTASQALLNRKGFTAAQIRNWVTIPENTSYLKINHAMVNDINVDPVSRFDAAPYVYEITLHLEAAGDDTSFDRHITVTQYPAMYIEAETNSAYPNNDYGYVYVNAQQNTSQNNWYLVSGLSGLNANPNMFIITSTILSDPNMILADPRTTTVMNGYNGGNNNWSPNDNSMYETGNRRLMYYYPTDNSDASKQKVSPKFRIASSYGKTYPVSRENAWQRCASYQEDGYPAGRWRIPTSAEVTYVVNLSANGFMDVLFGNPRTENESTNYWTASGYITVNNYTETVTPHDGNTTGNVYVRCVYDDWYWTDKAPDKTDSIWGDKLR